MSSPVRAQRHRGQFDFDGTMSEKRGHFQPMFTLYYIQRHSECENINMGRGQQGMPKGTAFCPLGAVSIIYTNNTISEQ